jgi:hypothetical protein
MDDMYYMDDDKLAKIISKFDMPIEKYTIKENGEFGESEVYWVIQNQNNSAQYLLVNTYWHPGLKTEIDFYKKEGFNINKPIQRRTETLEVSEDKNDPIRKYLYYDLYAIFLIQ